LTGEEYRQKGGGNFARWQQYITDWHRNLYSDIGLASAVGADERLILCTNGPEPLTQIGLMPLAMHAIALEKFPERRWLAKMPRRNAPLAKHLPQGVYMYSPMTEQLTSSGSTSSEQPK